MVKMRCLVRYTAPDGQVYAAGEEFAVTSERAAELQAWAEGQFEVVGDLGHPRAEVGNAGDNELGSNDVAGAPVDRAVRTAPKSRGHK
jgi:hypothetical protein